MDYNKEGVKRVNLSLPKKYLALTLFVVVLLILFTGGFGLFDFVKDKIFSKSVCGDRTKSDSCSDTLPYFCSSGILIENASLCGCPENFVRQGNSCVSVYSSTPKDVTLKYILDGEEKYLNFTVYGGFLHYLSGISKSIKSSNGETPSRGDFKINVVEEEEQRKILAPLVMEIQNLTKDDEEQVRIAVSLVQNIPYGASNQTENFGLYELDYYRFPYEVLYENSGICGEKSDLLAILLNEMGYGVGIFYYPLENHEALALKCPRSKSLDKTGYCFVETTAPSIISDDDISYAGIGKLSLVYELYPVSDGNSISRYFKEYSDASKLKRIRRCLGNNCLFSWLRKIQFEKLKEKYGLVEYYYSG